VIQVEAASVEHSPDGAASGVPVRISGATWRYLGDRAAADGAYCVRFGVEQAPEPYAAHGGVWVYALPVMKPV
jgi:hypothetical protein